MSAAISSGGGDTRGHYLYGIIEASGGSLPTGAPGVDGASPVTLLEHRDIAAVVSEVPLAEFGARALEHNVKDLQWLEDRTRAHEAVLERFLLAGPVLPARFCMIYRSSRHLLEVMAENYPSLRASLERVRGAREWGVKVLFDRDAAVKLEKTGHEAVNRSSGAAVGEGRAYFEARKLDQLVTTEVERTAATCADEAHARLHAYARDAKVLASPPAARLRVVMNAAYLVDTEREAAFEEALRRLAADYADRGLRFELTGPWPAYNFASTTNDAR